MLNQENETIKPQTNIPQDLWEQRANLAQEGLITQFWNQKRNMFDNLSPCYDLCNERFHYWWQAHAVETLVDALVRTGDVQYSQYLADFYQGIVEHNGGVLPNELYDDMEWMAIGWLRAYQATKLDTYKQAALTLWEDIKGGWNDNQGGGIAWQKSQLDYKNTPANAPAVILAARLFAEFGNADDLTWAKKIYDWQREHLVDPDSGFVWDGMNRLGDGQIDYTWEFTYCQGVYIGAGVELYRITGDKAYLNDASRTLHAAKLRLANPVTGILPVEGAGDGGLFKGIMIRYVGELVLEDPTQSEALDLLKTNAASLWDSGRDAKRQIFSDTWTSVPDPAVELSVNLSGVILVEQMARLEKSGLL
ncbi:glycosyl hydrolase [Paenibacillus psychroresistens]|uniref:Glycosyl hydrolase n=1 Tax=Paenibacillus psychroresistens TaxID=1778678 RepID=A0A6B8RGN3_9BACL|nr:glycoside hydrolase family 76 protein [Paenibacillus psychroresistens]QGQ95621.1 glycosyl hydrolase [Paenibacillus psychroresistens]